MCSAPMAHAEWHAFHQVCVDELAAFDGEVRPWRDHARSDRAVERKHVILQRLVS